MQCKESRRGIFLTACDGWMTLLNIRSECFCSIFRFCVSFALYCDFRTESNFPMKERMDLPEDNILLEPSNILDMTSEENLEHYFGILSLRVILVFEVNSLNSSNVTVLSLFSNSKD